MPVWRIDLTRTIKLAAIVEIEADTLSEAKEDALNLANLMNLKFDELYRDTSICICTEIKNNRFNLESNNLTF
jgi:predicted outer membrane protein